MELKLANDAYLRKHPELKDLTSHFLCRCFEVRRCIRPSLPLVSASPPTMHPPQSQPDDVMKFAVEYFCQVPSSPLAAPALLPYHSLCTLSCRRGPSWLPSQVHAVSLFSRG